MFADDTNLFSSLSNIKDLFNNVNLELNNIAVWFKANKLLLNEGKTKQIPFHKFRQKGNIPLKLPMLAINGKVIERTSKIIIGVLLDEHLSQKNHISVVENKVSKNIGILHKAKNIFSKGGLKTLYFSFVHSYLNYGNIAWGSTTRTKLKNTCKQTKTCHQSKLEGVGVFRILISYLVQCQILFQEMLWAQSQREQLNIDRSYVYSDTFILLQIEQIIFSLSY